ncbi:MAG: peptide deformylase [Deltaproteobacteria bacterium]|nr:peptide deformylase [Deltaproteobacteria bacterium]
MALLNILKYPDPFLKTKASPVDAVDKGIKTLVSDMIETMYYGRGIGLAAVQVKAGHRVAVLDVPDDMDKEGPERERGKNLIVLINPEIISSSGTIVYEEGCLSVPGVTADVTRADKVTVKALNRDGNPIEISAEGLLAIVIQHEIDHLDGLLFIDRLSRLKRDIIKRKLKKALEAEERAF